ncbi:hypothetical protein E4U34_000465 [Claviceps purpurea]|nr:hypothetical protein E4U34_000465 [Claviceps purpurea]
MSGEQRGGYRDHYAGKHLVALDTHAITPLVIDGPVIDGSGSLIDTTQTLTVFQSSKPQSFTSSPPPSSPPPSSPPPSSPPPFSPPFSPPLQGPTP